MNFVSLDCKAFAETLATHLMINVRNVGADSLFNGGVAIDGSACVIFEHSLRVTRPPCEVFDLLWPQLPAGGMVAFTPRIQKGQLTNWANKGSEDELLFGADLLECIRGAGQWTAELFDPSQEFGREVFQMIAANDGCGRTLTGYSVVVCTKQISG